MLSVSTKRSIEVSNTDRISCVDEFTKRSRQTQDTMREQGTFSGRFDFSFERVWKFVLDFCIEITEESSFDVRSLQCNERIFVQTLPTLTKAGDNMM